MAQNQKYKFVTAKPGKKPKTYFKSEDDLEEEEFELLYQEFARAWDFQPVKNKNRFLKWLVEQSNNLKNSDVV